MKFSTPNPALILAQEKAATEFVALKRVIAARLSTSSIGSSPLRDALAKRPKVVKP